MCTSQTVYRQILSLTIPVGKATPCLVTKIFIFSKGAIPGSGVCSPSLYIQPHKRGFGQGSFL